MGAGSTCSAPRGFGAVISGTHVRGPPRDALMELLLAKQASLKHVESRERIKEIDRWIERLTKERADLVRKASRAPPKRNTPIVECPRCGRDHDFLTDNGGYLAHVLED